MKTEIRCVSYPNDYVVVESTSDHRLTYVGAFEKSGVDYRESGVDLDRNGVKRLRKALKRALKEMA